MPNPNLVKRAREQMKRAADYQFFFDHLNSADWIPSLIEEGFLRDPPAPVVEGDYIRYPPWPESSYLARVAGQSPELVLSVIKELPETDNVLVLNDLVRAAASMPPDLSITLSDRILGWIDANSGRILADPLLDLARNFVQIGAAEQGIAIAGRLADFPMDPESAEQWANQERRRVAHWVDEPVTGFFQELAEDAAELAFLRVATSLSLILEAELGKPETTPERDGSYIWRPAIEPHDQNNDYDERSLLVTIVRDIAEQVVASEAPKLENLIAQLEEWRWAVFIRLVLHLVRANRTEAADRARELILRRDLFESINVRHEYYWLVRETLTAPDPPFDVSEYVSLVEGGPPDSLMERFKGTSEEDLALRSWMIERLHPVREVLPDDWSARYREWIGELGEPAHPDFPFYMSGASAVMSGSPLSADELSEMNTVEIVQFLTSWEPADGLGEPSVDDLGRALAAAVAREPTMFAESANDFELEEPTYVRHILDGFRQAVQHDEAFEWQAVLRLGQWVLEQSDEPFDRSDWHQDPDWSWARRSLADLVKDGLNSTSVPIPHDQEDLVWDLLTGLAEDPDPSPEHEAEYGGSNMDPLTLSLNSIRGSAFHAIVAFVDWVNKESEPDDRQIPDEVKSILDRHLDIEYDSSLSVRSVYGWGLGTLLDADEEWARARVDTIFPADPDLDAYRRAAWHGFMWHWRPSRHLFDVLLDPYRLAVQRIPNETGTATGIDADKRLADHLLSYYWWGIVDLNGDGLLTSFYERADDELRGHVIRTAGSALSGGEETPADVVERSITLWESRVESVEAEPEREYHSELEAFVWWFRSDQLDPAWLMEQLLSVAPHLDEIDSAFVVMERLPGFVDDYPVLTLKTLRALIERDQWGHVALGHRGELREVLATAMDHGGEAQERARDLINWLAARGVEDFGDLL